MALSEFIEESWKLALYAILIFSFTISLLYAWHNYQSSLEYADKLREARMLVTALLNEWGEDGVVDINKISEENLPKNAAVSFYTVEGRLLKALGQADVQELNVKVPVVVDGEEGYMLLRLGE
jgi:hypothetical protein